MKLIKSLVLVPLFAAGMALADAPAAAGSDQGAYFAPFIRFDPDAGNLDVTFGIDRAARVSLHAYDTQGKLLAILMDADQGSGFHQLSLFSNRLRGNHGQVVFKLLADNSMLADTRLSAR